MAPREAFDEFTRALAAPTSRRQTLRLLGLALLGTVMGGTRTLARGTCPPGQATCGQGCCYDSETCCDVGDGSSPGCCAAGKVCDSDSHGCIFPADVIKTCAFFGGKQTYKPFSECCTPEGKVPKHPIAKLASCPKRVPRPGHVPSANGCGPAGKPPLDSDTVTWGGVNFTPACNQHDLCYDTCNAPRVNCDTEFLRDMQVLCGSILHLPLHSIVKKIRHSNCMNGAALGYSAVRAGGKDAYEQAQKQACNCC